MTTKRLFEDLFDIILDATRDYLRPTGEVGVLHEDLLEHLTRWAYRHEAFNFLEYPDLVGVVVCAYNVMIETGHVVVDTTDLDIDVFIRMPIRRAN